MKIVSPNEKIDVFHSDMFGVRGHKMVCKPPERGEITPRDPHFTWA